MHTAQQKAQKRHGGLRHTVGEVSRGGWGQSWRWFPSERAQTLPHASTLSSLKWKKPKGKLQTNYNRGFKAGLQISHGRASSLCPPAPFFLPYKAHYDIRRHNCSWCILYKNARF